MADGHLAVTERAAGGTFGAPVPVASMGDPEAGDLTVALSGRGDALVAWSEQTSSDVRIRAVLRPAGPRGR